jgi:hypothetical protein
MDKAARVFFHPDFRYGYVLFPPVEHDVHGGVLPQLHRIPGQGMAGGHGRGGEVEFPGRLPDNGAAEPAYEQTGFADGLGVQNRDGARLTPANRAGGVRSARTKGFCSPVGMGVFSQENAYFQCNMGFVQKFTSKIKKSW